MKTRTHNIFTTGVLTLTGALFIAPVYSFISAALISVISNNIIDKYGHETNRFGETVRTYRTHSPLRALFWGFTPALVLIAVVPYLRNSFIFPVPAYFYCLSAQGLLAGELHLLLDLPTEDGIFINKKHVALGHFAYNNPLVNLAAAGAGFLLIYLAFTGVNYEKIYSISNIFNSIRYHA